MKITLIFITAMILAGTGGYALQKYLNQNHSQAQYQNNPAIGLQRPEFAVTDLEGKLRNIKEWDGKLVFLNFWATWCPPCLKEIPDFIELQKKYGSQNVQFIGIAIDELAAVREYADDVGMNYPTLVAEAEGVGLAKRFGNGAGVLPYTVIINRDGEISHTIMGELSKMRAKELMEERDINL
jgi:thiol-disulfide isomerase/thioredoxin